MTPYRLQCQQGSGPSLPVCGLAGCLACGFKPPSSKHDTSWSIAWCRRHFSDYYTDKYCRRWLLFLSVWHGLQTSAQANGSANLFYEVCGQDQPWMALPESFIIKAETLCPEIMAISALLPFCPFKKIQLLNKRRRSSLLPEYRLYTIFALPFVFSAAVFVNRLPPYPCSTAFLGGGWNIGLTSWWKKNKRSSSTWFLETPSKTVLVWTSQRI